MNDDLQRQLAFARACAADLAHEIEHHVKAGVRKDTMRALVANIDAALGAVASGRQETARKEPCSCGAEEWVPGMTDPTLPARLERLTRDANKPEMEGTGGLGAPSVSRVRAHATCHPVCDAGLWRMNTGEQVPLFVLLRVGSPIPWVRARTSVEEVWIAHNLPRWGPMAAVAYEDAKFTPCDSDGNPVSEMDKP